MKICYPLIGFFSDKITILFIDETSVMVISLTLGEYETV